jgi:ABC-type multidrug transport system permease subunit
MSERVRRRPLLELTKTRLREFLRERGTLFWVFGFPLLMAVGLGLAFRNRPAELPRVAVVADAPSPLVDALLRNGRLRAERMSATAAQKALATAKIDLIVEHDGAGPAFRFDPTQERALLAQLIAKDVLEQAAGRSDRLAVRETTVTEPGSRYIDFLLPGLIGLNLMGSSMWGVGYNLVVARKRRLLRRYAVTPMRRSHFLLSYVLSRSIFLALELSLLLAFGALAFGTVVRGSYAAVAVVALLAAASFAGLSLIIGARVDNLESANGWMNFVQLPMWVLSGAFFAYERFPEWLHTPIRLLPLTAVNDALRRIFNEGASLASCWPELSVLGAWCALGFGLSLRYFKWQ